MTFQLKLPQAQQPMPGPSQNRVNSSTPDPGSARAGPTTESLLRPCCALTDPPLLRPHGPAPAAPSRTHPCCPLVDPPLLPPRGTAPAHCAILSKVTFHPFDVDGLCAKQKPLILTNAQLHFFTARTEFVENNLLLFFSTTIETKEAFSPDEAQHVCWNVWLC